MAILKNLIVHGPSHFIDKVFINDSHIAKINESNVPENPKFTDTVSSASTTGTGNAITEVSVSNGSFTFTKGSTFLTSQNTAALYAGTSAATANTSAANTSAHLILKDGTTYNRIKIQGTAGIEVTASSNGVLSVGVPAQSPNTFYAGPSSGTNAIPNFRNIGLADLPHDTTITSNSSSQNIPTTSAVSAYVNEEVDKIKIGGRNLILDTSKTMISPESTNNSAYVFIYLSDYGNSVIDNNTTDFFTYSFDYEVTGNTAEGAFIYAQIRGTSVNNVVSGYSVFPSEAPVGKYCCVFKLTNAQSTSTNKTASIRLRNATNGAILTVKNAKLERGNKATDWTPAPEDLTIQTEGISEIADLALTEGIEYIEGTQETATSSWEGKTRDSKTVTGKTIAYKLPVAGSTVGTTTLTLVDKTTGQTRYSGTVKMNNTAVTTHYPAQSVIKLTYDGEVWRSDFYNTNSSLSRANTTASASFLPILMGNHATTTATRNSTGYKDVTRFAYQPSTQTLKVGQVSASKYTGSGVLETQLTSNTTDDDKLPTALAIKNSLGYVTPQMFGAKANGIDDDTLAIQTALDASLNVFLPPGIYIISYPLFIRSGTHFYGAASGATTIKAKVDTTNGTAFSINNMPHSSGFSNINIQLNNLTQDQINTCRYLFVQEPEIGTYMLIVAESIRSQYANETGSLKRPGFTAGNTGSFLIENLTLDCNHTRANYPVNNVGVGVGGLRLIRPYDRCNIKNIFVNNCTCRAIYVGDAVSPSYIQSNYTAWMNFENLTPSEEPDEQPEDLVKMVRRRTRSQTLAIDNCQFMGSKTGSKFTPDTYLYTYWRPNTYYPYTWQKLTDIYTFNTSEYNKITSTQVTFNGSNGTTAITPNSAGTAAGLSGYYVHNKIAVGGNLWLSNQTDYLAYFYNSFQLNLKDTKIMYSSANFKIYPCVVFNNCTDLYVRGCSFAHTLGEGIRLTGGTKYFRLVANTYENLGVIKTNNGQPTGNGFKAGGLHNMFKTKSFESTSSLFTDRDYVIYCDGEPASDTTKRAPIVGGIIIETTYNNTPRDVYLQHTNDMFIIGTFKQLKTSIDDINTVVIGNLTGAIETSKFSTENLFKSYSVTTSSASSVGGWTYLGSTSLSAPQGMVPIGVVVLSTSDTRPATAYISGGNLYVRSTSNGASFTVRVTFAKS